MAEMIPEKILYAATMTARGGREGQASAPDGSLSLRLSVPAALGGPGGDGTNPEKLFAAGYVLGGLTSGRPPKPNGLCLGT